MKHLPVLLCGLLLAGSLPLQVEAAPAASATSSAHYQTQRLARLDAPSMPPAASAGNACLSMIADDPADALDDADDWLHHGGGGDASQCRALATIALGDPESGALALDRLSQDRALPSPRRALFADEAARAWLLAGHPDRALTAAGLATELDPSPVFAIEHARAALAAHQPAQVISDLFPVLAAHADLPDALVVRAAALRETGALDQSRMDIDAACRLEPDSTEALLERGVLRERMGDLDGARGDWSRVISLSPDTHDADLAQQDLALLDAGPEAR